VLSTILIVYSWLTPAAQISFINLLPQGEASQDPDSVVCHLYQGSSASSPSAPESTPKSPSKSFSRVIHFCRLCISIMQRILALCSAYTLVDCNSYTFRDHVPVCPPRFSQINHVDVAVLGKRARSVHARGYLHLFITGTSNCS
jgi:rRNA maturation protein Nop10